MGGTYLSGPQNLGIGSSLGGSLWQDSGYKANANHPRGQVYKTTRQWSRTIINPWWRISKGPDQRPNPSHHRPPEQYIQGQDGHSIIVRADPRNERGESSR